MKSFYINLNQTAEKGSRYRKFLVNTAIVLALLLLVTYLILYSMNVDNLWIYYILGFYVAAFIYVAFSGYKTEMYISADENALEFQTGFYQRTPFSILWASIGKVKIGPTYITFFKRSGRKKTLRMGWLPYEKLTEIKSKIENLCLELDIEIEYGEIRRDF